MKYSAGFLKRHDLLCGIVLMFLFTWPIDLAHAAEVRGLIHVKIPFVIYIFLGWGFVFASVLMTWLILGGDAVCALLKRFLIWRVGVKWYVLALFVFPALDAIAVVLAAASTHTRIDFSSTFAHKIFGPSANMAILFAPYLLFDAVTNGEEMGWRGYVLPRLQSRYNALVASLILGAIWGLWHLPKAFAAGDPYSLLRTVAETLVSAVIFTWIFNNTRGSLLLVTLLHASTNAAGVFLPLANTQTGKNTGALMVAIALEAAVAIVVVAVTGAARLSQTEPKQVQA